VYKTILSRFSNLSFAAFDQAAVSGLNFITSILLARLMLPSEYGYYVLGFTTLTIFVGLQDAAIFKPLCILGAPLARKPWHNLYLNALGLEFISSFFVIILLIIPILKMIGKSIDINFIILFSFTCFFFVLREYFRRALIARIKFKKAFINDFLSNILKIFLIIVFYSLKKLNIYTVFGIFLVSCLFGTMLGYFQIGIFTIKFFKFDKKIISEIWNYGKWTLADWGPFMVSSHLYIYVVAIIWGIKLTAALGACKSLIGPIITFMIAITNYASPYATKYYWQGDKKKFILFLKKLFFMGLPFVLCYCILVTIFSEDILNILYHGKYTEYKWVLILFSFHIFLAYLYKPAEIYLQVTKNPKYIFISRFWISIFSLILSFPLVKYFGIYGANLGYIFVQFCLFLSLNFFMYKLEKLAVLKKVQNEIQNGNFL